MRWVNSIVRELLGLFVDDEAFAIAIIAWLGIIWLLSLHVLQGVRWSGAILFAGLGIILLQSTLRRSRK